MNLEEFEVQSQSAIEEILNHLQTTNLLVTQAEEHVEELGQSVQNLSRLIEEFITQQRSQNN
jgi:tRNA uridine 5-carbamoylmethylation protein Kti12